MPEILSQEPDGATDGADKYPGMELRERKACTHLNLSVQRAPVEYLSLYNREIISE